MGGLRILITNNTLSDRAGSELYVRDLALELLRRGHTPIAYSPRPGQIGEEMRRATIPVVDRLDALGAPPDVIHGQHHLPTMEALLTFVDTPAVYFCHGWLPWEEAPPRFPRIYRYVAVDDTCGDRVLLESGVPESQLRVILNFVDLDRFSPRPPLPPKPQRALVFSNYASDETHLGVIRATCARLKLPVDVIGAASGTAVAAPERVIGGYDVVFAKGRAALEALAVGAAVILCDAVGAGPMVTTRDLAQLRRANFGIRALRHPLTPEILLEELQRYDAADAMSVSRTIRQSASLQDATDEILDVYGEVLDEHRRRPPTVPDSEARATAAYVRWLGLRLTMRNEPRRELRGSRVGTYRGGVRRVLRRLRRELHRLWRRRDER